MDALRQYELRGLAYLAWSSHEDMAPDSPYRTRSLTDGLSMFVDTTDVSSVRYFVPGDELGQVQRDGRWAVPWW